MRFHSALTALVSCLLVSIPMLAASPTDRNDLHIDVPVVLKEAKVVFNLDHLAFEGDEPTGLHFLRVMTERFRVDQTDARIIAIFHGAAGYMLLDDVAYDKVRNWQHGNPYKDQIAELQRDGVEIEECGQTMADNHWRNAELLPGVKVNSGANFRIVQLVQEGFVQLQP
jgi:intracellular sulfur oxidation DsrE/DsrF family protein